MPFTKVWESEAYINSQGNPVNRFYINEGTNDNSGMPEGYTVLSLWEYIPDEGSDNFVQQSGYIELDERDAYLVHQQRRAKTLSDPANYRAWVEYEMERDREEARRKAEADRQRAARRAAQERIASTFQESMDAIRSILAAASNSGNSELEDEIIQAALAWRRAEGNDRRNLTNTAPPLFDEIENKYGHLDG